MRQGPRAGARPSDWWGGVYRTTQGEAVRVYVSDLYPVDDAKARAWVDFLAGLVHGSELARLTLYLAPEAMVSRICGGGALGCYAPDDESITLIGDAIELPDPLSVEQVLAHEYGHHVANNRENSPWSALARGTKRWATAERICVRVREGSAGDRYDRDPAEAFAESYRLLADRASALPFVWPIVDPSFVPGPKALAALREDVLVPWTPKTVRLHGVLRRANTLRFTIATPYDGSLTARVQAAPGDLVAQVRILSMSGASASRVRTATTVCGERHVRLVVRSLSGHGRFTLVVTKP